MASQGTKKTVAAKTPEIKALEAEATGAQNIKVEFRGESLDVDPEVLDDFELLDLLSKGVPSLAFETMVPDPRVRERLLDTCEKNAAGRTKLSSVNVMMTEMMGALGAGK